MVCPENLLCYMPGIWDYRKDWKAFYLQLNNFHPIRISFLSLLVMVPADKLLLTKLKNIRCSM